MGICGSKNQATQPQKTNQPGQQQQPTGFLAFVQYKFDQINPFAKPQAASKQTGTVGDNIVPAAQSDRVANLYDAALQRLGGGRFSDPEFPANVSSLSKNPSGFKASQNVTWRVAKDFMQPGKIFVFDKIEPMDIKQGGLGDCYFLSSLSALAEYPGTIEKLFVTREYQDNGLYCVWLCHDGEFVQVLLDDFFPCVQNGGPVFSKSNGNELWVLLLEKAYAKIYGNYEKIEAGLAGNALKDLTGAPYEYLVAESGQQPDVELNWKFLQENIKKKYILAASSETDARGVEFEQTTGIISQHCYAILDAQQVASSNGQQDRIVQLRNPWGHKEWTGDWSDSSGKWTPELRQKLNVKNLDDGIFWMGISDFVKDFKQVPHFTIIEVCVSKLHPSYQYCAIKLKHQQTPVQTSVVLMRVFQKSHLFLSLSQKDKRNFAKEPQIQYKYSLARMLIGCIDKQTNQVSSFVGGTMDNDRDIKIETDLEAGDYAVYCELDWAQSQIRHLVLNSYGDQAVSFQETDMAEVAKLQILDGLIRTHPLQVKGAKVHEYGDDIVKTSGSVAGYVYFLYTNKSSNATLNETLKMTSRKNLKICAPFDNNDEYIVHVGPTQDVLVKYRITAEENGSFSYATSTSSNVLKQYSKTELRDLALNHPTKVTTRDYNGAPAVYINFHSYSSGVVILYQNKCAKTYKEQLKLNLTNLAVEGGEDPSKISIQIAPSEEYLLLLKVIDATKGTSYGMQMSLSFA